MIGRKIKNQDLKMNGIYANSHRSHPYFWAASMHYAFLKKRKKIYLHYKKKLTGINDNIKFPDYQKNISPSYHLILLNINFKKLKKSKNEFFDFMKKRNIFLQYHYIPIYKFSIVKNLIWKLKIEIKCNTNN